jgi:alanine-glyoxylate transaminase / serine-glyoxylate transaminase / serine-pyruvate transaminase
LHRTRAAVNFPPLQPDRFPEEVSLDLSSLTPRLLLGPGPSPVSPRILEALSRPTLGHLDPQFLEVLDDVSEGLRRLFETKNPTTFPVSGTGSAGMEAAMVNLLEPDDTAIVGINGVFGTRLAEMGRRMGARVVEVEAEWGRILDPDRLIEAHRAHPDARLMAVVHAETSTGARQPLEELGAHLRGTDTLFVVDAVTSLGGIPVKVDAWGVDVCYSGTQKCLGVPPGLAPITFSPRAVERIRSRKSPVASWYLDVTLISGYLGSERRYHHTAPINLIYALHEALTEVGEEGLEARFRRHGAVGARLQSELADRGFRSFTDESHRLPQLTAVHLPGDGDEAPPRAALLADHGIEVGGGLGPAKGKIWRIGLMGHGARDESVDRLLGAVDEVLGAG